MLLHWHCGSDLKCLPDVSCLQTRNYVSEEILRMEPDEGLEKLQDAIKICRCYVSTYHDRRSHLDEYFEGGEAVVRWEFQPTLVFARMDRLISQLQMMQVRVQVVGGVLREAGRKDRVSCRVEGGGELGALHWPTRYSPCG